ncbi:MAG: ABC transporter permease [Thermoleophilia bacterium]|nr:ABC transporter permease [Thermoleophilia bacterium]
MSAAGGYAFSPRGALRMWQRNATVGRKTLVTTLTPRFLEAIAYLAIMGLGLGAYLTRVEGVPYVDFIAPGVAAATVMFGAVIETTYNSFVRIHVRKVVEAVITTPLSLADVVVGEYLWAATRAVVYGVVFLIVMAAFGLVASPLALLAPLVFAVGALTFAVLGMAYTAMVTNIEHYNIFFTGILTPMFLFGGIFFPFTELPGWAQAVGWLLPLSHLVAATRDLTLGGADLLTLAHVGALLALLALVFPFPARRLRRTLMR